jgi:uncharacterized protein
LDAGGLGNVEAGMRKLIAACGLLAGGLGVVAQAPSVHVRAETYSSAKEAGHRVYSDAVRQSASAVARVDAAKEADIRRLMEVTGAKDLGEQVMNAGIAQFRASVTESQPDNPRAKQFADAFAARFEKHFDPRSLTETVIPIYDKHLSAEDLKELLAYYQSPFGQRMLKVLPEVARESQVAGFTLGQKAAQEAMEELKGEYPEFVPNSSDEEKRPATDR